MAKRIYEAPTCEVVDIAIERGYAATSDGTQWTLLGPRIDSYFEIMDLTPNLAGRPHQPGDGDFVGTYFSEGNMGDVFGDVIIK